MWDVKETAYKVIHLRGNQERPLTAKQYPLLASAVYGKFLQIYHLSMLSMVSSLNVQSLPSMMQLTRPQSFRLSQNPQMAGSFLPKYISDFFNCILERKISPPPLSRLIISKWAMLSMLINDNLKTMKRLTIGDRAILIIDYLPSNLYIPLPYLIFVIFSPHRFSPHRFFST